MFFLRLDVFLKRAVEVARIATLKFQKGRTFKKMAFFGFCLEFFGFFWNFPDFVGIFRKFLEFFGFCWNFSEFSVFLFEFFGIFENLCVGDEKFYCGYLRFFRDFLGIIAVIAVF